MVFHHTIWLLLAIPLGAAMWLWPPATPLLRKLRIAGSVLLLLGMAGLAVKLPGRAGTLVVVADRSESMPSGSEASQKEAITMLQGAVGSDQRLAVVSFGQTAAIEQTPRSGGFTGFATEVGRNESNLADAIDKALSLIAQDSAGRVLILSDGRWTGRDPAAAASRAATRGIALDYRSMQRATAGDLAITQIDAPGSVTPGESFAFTVWVNSPARQEASVELQRGGTRLAAGRTNLTSGLNRLTFRDQANEAGVYSYLVRVAAGDDPLPENNTARFLLGIEGPKPVLCVSQSRNSGLARLISAGGLAVKSEPPEELSWSLDELSKYSAVVLENVPAEKIGTRGMENIAAWVKETGAGLVMTGGRNSYGPGGYFRSPLEPILPVSMELRREHRKLAMAIVVALDRSGSMSAPTGGGKTKMDLANLAAVQVLDLMSPVDEFGVIAVDSSPHIIANLSPVSDAATVRRDILRIGSEGGGIFIYEALSASARMLLEAKAGTRHIILFADAADSEEPGRYQELITKCREAGITISVIGLGKPGDQDAELLRDIAQRGGGRCFFTENPEELPRLFAQDTFVVSRSTFIDEETQIQFTGGLTGLTGRQLEQPPAVGGYNLCYLRPEANLASVTVDDYDAPVIAAWQAGAGRVLCYTGEADGAHSGAIAGWNQVGDLFSSLVKWSAGDVNTLSGDTLVTQELKNGLVSVTLHLDPERESEPFADLPELTTLHGTPGSAPLVDKRDFRWTSADTLEVEVPLRGGETSLSTLDIAGAGRRTLAPVCLPYSPEFKPVEPDAGLLALDRLARATNGKERANLAGVWREMPARPRLFEMSPWLLSMALVLFLLEVLQRRTALLSSGPGFITVARKSAAATVRPVSLLFPAMKRRRFRRVSGASEVADKNRLAGEDRPGRSAIEASNALRRQVENSRLDGSDGEVRAASTTSGGNNEPSSASAPDQGVVDALRRARSRASKRTRQP